MVVWYAGFITLIGAITAIIIMMWIASQHRPKKQAKEIKKKIYGVRFWYILSLLSVFALLLIFTFAFLPYYQNQKKTPDVAVSVIGKMWDWQFSSADNASNSLKRDSSGTLVLPLHKTIEFQVTSKDVNHGFGIYHSDGHLLAQTQAMPGYINRLVYTFDEPGEYSVLCLEYCGLAHHMMHTRFKVE